jgi:hypothetical protein
VPSPLNVLHISPPLRYSAIRTVTDTTGAGLVKLHAANVVQWFLVVMVIVDIGTTKSQRSQMLVQIAPWITAGLLCLVCSWEIVSQIDTQVVVAKKLRRNYAYEQNRIVSTISRTQASKPDALPATISATEMVLASRVGNNSALPVRTATGMLQPFVFQVNLMVGVQIEHRCL